MNSCSFQLSKLSILNKWDPKDGGRYCFQFVSPHLHGEGTYPIPGLGGGVPHPRSGWWGVPHPRSGWSGGTPSQVWMVGGYTIPGLDGGGGTSRVPPTRTGWGNPPPTHTHIRQSSIASTCYAAGSMLLAFTQEDFLVIRANFTHRIR